MLVILMCSLCGRWGAQVGRSCAWHGAAVQGALRAVTAGAELFEEYYHRSLGY